MKTADFLHFHSTGLHRIVRQLTVSLADARGKAEAARRAALKNGSGLVFLGQRRGVPMSDMTLTAVLRRMGKGDLTAHGFRSTFRDWAAESTHHPNHVVEQALAHGIGSAVEAAYRRGDLIAKRRALMDDWAAYLAKPAAQVVRPGFGKQRAAHEVVS